MRRALNALIIIILAFTAANTFYATSASASSNYPFIGSATKENVNVHRGALSGYKVTGILSKQQEVHVLSEFTNANNEVWVQVKNNNLSGWVKQNDIAAAAFSPAKMTVTGNNVNMRKGATTSYSIVATLTLGQTVEVVDRFLNQNLEVWYRVKINNQYGWVIGTYLTYTKNEVTPKPNPTVPTDANFVVYAKENLHVRRGALTTYSITATIPKGEKLNVVATFTNNAKELWYRVKLSDNTFGWVLSVYTQQNPILNELLYINVDSANVRSGATTSYKVVATLAKNTAVKVIDQHTNNNGELWYRLDLNNGLKGWISSSLLSTKPVEMNKSLIVGTLSAEMRRGADFGYRVTQKLTPYSSVRAVSEFFNSKNEKWINIELSNGVRGWVPAWELYSSLTNREVYYSKQNNVLRRGASSGYRVNTNIKLGESLIYLQKHNGWLNVEAPNGVRGWIPENQLVKIVPNVLGNIQVSQLSANETLLTWTKSKNFPVSYSIQSDKSLRVNASNILIDIPHANIKGLKNIQPTKDYFIITPEAGYSFTIRHYDDKLTVKISSTGISGKRILIDAGHGNQDPGAVGPTGLREKDVNLAVAKFLQAELEKKGALVTLTRDKDVFLTLSERTDISNNSHFDAFVSIHANANYNSAARGTETYYNINTNFNGPKSVLLASYVQKALVSQLNTLDRGHKPADFYVIKNNQVPSILVELAFLTNPAEESMLRTEGAQRRAATGILQGLETYFNGGY